MSAHDVKLFGDAVAASRLETRFARIPALALVRLAIEDLFPRRIALVSSFGADSVVLLDMVSRIDKATPIVVLCHHGMRSKSAAERILRDGFTQVYNLEGGIDAWSQKVDTTVPRY